MLKKTPKRQALTGVPRNFNEFLRHSFIVKTKKAIEPQIEIENKPPVNIRAEAPSIIPRNLKRESKLLQTAIEKLPDQVEKQDQANDIDETRAEQWLMAMNNINQKLLLPLPKKSVKNLVRSTIKEPALVYPLAHSMKDKTSRMRAKTVQKLSRNPWGVELVAACLIALIAACYVSRLDPVAADQIIAYADKVIFYPLQRMQDLKYSHLSVNTEIFSDFIAKNKDKFPANKSGKTNSYTITARDLFGQVAGAQEITPSEFSVDKNHAVAVAKADVVLFKTASFLKIIYNNIASAQHNLSAKLKNELAGLATK